MSDDQSDQTSAAEPMPTTEVRISDWISRPAWLIRFVWMVVAIVAVSAVLYWSFTRVSGFLSILFTALFLSFALEPAVNKLARHMKRGYATLIVFLIFVALIAIFIPLLVMLVIHESGLVRQQIPSWINDANAVFERFNISFRLSMDEIQTWLSGLDVGQLSGEAVGFATDALGALARTVTILLFTILLTVNGPRFRRTVLKFLPPQRQQVALEVWEVSIQKTGGYFYSRGVVAIAGALAVFLSMIFVSFVPVSHSDIRVAAIPVAIFYGLINAFIPIIGAYAGLILPVLVVAISGGPVQAIILLVIVLIYKQIEDYAISPRVAANKMQINAGVAIAAVLVGAELLGVTGALLALPVAAIVQALLSTYLSRYNLVESDLYEDTPTTTPEPSTKPRRRLSRKRSLGTQEAGDRAEPGAKPQ